MEMQEIDSRVRKVLAEQLAVDESQVVPDARFAEDLNADSLDLVEAVLALEEEWGIEIPEEEMDGVKTVGEEAGWPVIAADRGGVVIAPGIGGIETLLQQHSVLLEKGPGRVSPFMVPALMANASAGHVAMRFGLTGPNLCTVTACASGAHAVGEGFRMIRDGMIELAIVGGSEAATLPLTVSAFAQMQALTKNPDRETASRPFDAERDGFVLSEGSCVLILEEAERSAARGARGYA